jgi:hypothetical protein
MAHAVPFQYTRDSLTTETRCIAARMRSISAASTNVPPIGIVSEGSTAAFIMILLMGRV